MLKINTIIRDFLVSGDKCIIFSGLSLEERIALQETLLTLDKEVVITDGNDLTYSYSMFVDIYLIIREALSRPFVKKMRSIISKQDKKKFIFMVEYGRYKNFCKIFIVRRTIKSGYKLYPSAVLECIIEKKPYPIKSDLVKLFVSVEQLNKEYKEELYKVLFKEDVVFPCNRRRISRFRRKIE